MSTVSRLRRMWTALIAIAVASSAPMAGSMPADLQRHVRYPGLLLHEQAEVYGHYHLSNPDAFYRAEDVWQLPQTADATGGGSRMASISAVPPCNCATKKPSAESFFATSSKSPAFGAKPGTAKLSIARAHSASTALARSWPSTSSAP